MIILFQKDGLRPRLPNTRIFQVDTPKYVFMDMNCDQLRVDTLILQKQDEWWVIKILCRRYAGSGWIKRIVMVLEVMKVQQECRWLELVSYPLG